MEPCKKVKYATEKAADDDITRIYKTSNRSKVPVRSYLCKCGFWHLTSKKHQMEEKIENLLNELDKLRKEKKEEKNARVEKMEIAVAKFEMVKALKKTIKEQDVKIKNLENTIAAYEDKK